MIYGLQKETYNPNQINQMGYANNNISIPDNHFNNNISPQNNYMLNSNQGMGNYQNTNQIKKNNNLGKIFFLT